jgi:uncharacterized membrane protein
MSDTRVTPWTALRATFGRGIVVLIPVVFTLWILSLLFNFIDGLTSPIYDEILGRHIKGIGFITMLGLILIVGVLSRNFIGRTVGAFIEKVISTIPFARSIYAAVRDLFQAIQTGGKGKSFREVVLFEYPRQGLWTVGFVTNKIELRGSAGDDELVSVYIPSPPNPTAGNLVLVPRRHIQILQMSVEEGLKFVLSGGIVTTGTLTTKQP